jgi:hypothetical protein
VVEVAVILSGIRQLVRVGSAANAALIQHEIDGDVLVPALQAVRPETRVDLIKEIFSHPDRAARLEAGGDLDGFWDFAKDEPSALRAGAEDVLYLAALEVKVQLYGKDTGVPVEQARAVTGVRVLRQWSEDAQGDRPLKPLPRFLLVLADSVLEVVGANPALLGVGGHGEKLVGSLATNLASLIPDDAEEFGPQSQFADRLLRLFLRGSLQVLHEQSDRVFSEQHVAQLARSFLEPVIAALPKDMLERQRWQDVADALAGPAARAAFEVLAANPQAFLGRDLDPSRAVGALTQGLLREAGRLGLRAVWSEAGAVALYRAALAVAVERPELFTQRAGDRTTEGIATSLLRGVAETLQRAPQPFAGDLGVALAVAVLDTLRGPGAALLPAGTVWEQAVSALVLDVANALHTGLHEPDAAALDALFSRDQLVRFARTFIGAAAQHPEWLGGRSRELAAVIRAVASARRADARGLLGPEAWIEIAREVIALAAADPGRLFPVDDAGEALAAALIADLLKVASADAAHGRAGLGVLFGATLQTAIGIALRGGVGRARAAAQRRPELAVLAELLCTLARERSEEVDSRAWLALYERLLPRVLDGESVRTKTQDALIALLAEGR